MQGGAGGKKEREKNHVILFQLKIVINKRLWGGLLIYK